MSISLAQLADWVEGEIEGDGQVPITAARTVAEAQPGDITFAVDEHYLAELHHCHASAAVVSKGARSEGKHLIRVHDPLAAFIRIFRRLQPRPAEAPAGMHPSACVHPSAEIGADVYIAPFAVIGAGSIIGASCQIHSGSIIGAGCRLGEGVVLHPHVVLYDQTILGNGVIIHAHSVIGADGFGYRTVDGRHVKTPQLGHVEIGDDVEIGACTTIDRGTFGPTRIGAGTKIDNLVQIAHNCQIGRNNIIVSQAGIAGSTRTGDRVIVAGQAGIRDNVRIGDRAVIGPKAGVTKDIAEGEWVLGTPAVPERDFKLVTAASFKLPEMRRLLRRIAKHLGLEEPRA